MKPCKVSNNSAPPMLRSKGANLLAGDSGMAGSFVAPVAQRQCGLFPEADGGSTPTSALQLQHLTIREIPRTQAASFIADHHYSKVMPKLTKLIYGGFADNRLVACITLGWGVRPHHTIAKLFPSLTSKDYLEIGKMCLSDDLPRNSETMFMAEVFRRVRKSSNIKLIFTWSDGMVGKPGFVYQAANFLYGGHIWTDSYFTEDGQKIHPRSSRHLCDINGREVGRKLFWLTFDFMERNGLARYKGKQFRYVLFLCDKTTRNKLLSESTVKWGTNYPKESALAWKIYNGKTYIPCERPAFTASASAADLKEA